MRNSFLTELQVNNFRNLRRVGLKFGSALNLLLGDNGEGKTNLLEAISLSSSLRTLRACQSNSDLILFGEGSARIASQFSGQHASKIEVHIEVDRKFALLHNKRVKSARVLAERHPTVSFLPEDTQIIFGSGGSRRRLMDQVAYAMNPGYIDTYRNFEQILLERNKLLKTTHFDALAFQIYNQLYLDQAALVILDRLQALQNIRPFFSAVLLHFSPALSRTQLSYTLKGKSVLDDSKLQAVVIKEKLSAAFEYCKKIERIREQTLFGPHLDDLLISFDNNPLRPIASRGQARVLTLAFKIALLQLIKQAQQSNAMLLLDDVIGELDPSHARHLFEIVEQLETQCFITTTHLSALPNFAKERARLFEMKALVEARMQSGS